jgi:hypothetical protein
VNTKIIEKKLLKRREYMYLILIGKGVFGGGVAATDGDVKGFSRHGGGVGGGKRERGREEVWWYKGSSVA